MPFDAPTEVKVEIRILDRMEELLATPEKWCKGILERDGARCLLGALNEADHGDPLYRWPVSPLLPESNVIFVTSGAERVCDTLVGLVPITQPYDDKAQPIAWYNNAETTTHADILNLIDKARQKILEGT